jgi:acetoin utilization deacetylase AcuC-like enzyme
VFSAAACLLHDQGGGHPESPARLAAVLGALAQANVAVTSASATTFDALQLVHPGNYLQRARALSDSGGGELGVDINLNAHSWDAALAAGGAALAALEHALAGRGNAFAAIRPPGHHALGARGMGFCIVNHVAVLAATALARGCDRVLIVDWDVHHGNGTQALVERESRVHFVSMHQWPWYPGTGRRDERGVGNCFNVPMQAGLPALVYIEALWDAVARATAGWSPQLILISAGYDSMLGDPLGGFTLGAEHFAQWIERIRDAFPGAPIVALMEGGYNPTQLARGALATVAALA